MSTTTLPSVYSNVSGELEALVPRLLRPDHTLAVVQRVWKAYRVKGVIELFMTGSAAGFCDSLQKSAQVAVNHLTARRSDGLPLSRMTPFFDALAGQDGVRAGRIAELCAHTRHLPDSEYLDDYLYVRYLMSTWIGDRTRAIDALRDLRRLVDGAESTQLLLCEALDSRDALALADALDRRLDEHETHYRLLLERGAVTEDEWVSEAQLSFEALGVVRVAARLGMELEWNYKFVPSVVIRARAEALPDDAWQEP